MSEELFELGEIKVTPAALEMITQFGVLFVLSCHVIGNYGNVSEVDYKLNQWAIDNGERILSTYSGIWEKPIFVVTERDRSLTTVLLAEDY